MAFETQAKVLRVLQEHEFERVGGTAPVDVDVRVVAATHRDLEEEVKAGRFREDLYYRLKVVELDLPPLRDRLEDLPALVERFSVQLAERLDRERVRISPEALARLACHAWPGNVRELRNVIERAGVLCSGERIEEADLQLDRAPAGDAPRPSDADASFRDAKRKAVEDFEREYLLGALRENGGNISRTASAIGMVRQSLQQKIRELGLRSEDWSDNGS
jgi:DNA-binding NtrC family response regulator